MSLEERVRGFISGLLQAPTLTRFRFPLKLGREWFELKNILVEACGAGHYRTTIQLCALYVVFLGNEDELVNDITFLMRRGVCRDCGDTNAMNHVCRNSGVNSLYADQVSICSICLEECKGTTRMPCGHAFHWICLSGLFGDMSRAPCPNCRKRALRSSWDYHFEPTDYSSSSSDDI